MKSPPITLYFDGLCPLCSREIAYYRSRANGAPVTFVDITDPGFNAASHGIDLSRAHKVLHVKRGERILTGVDAAIAIWDAIPGYAWLARLARLPVLYGIMTLGYHVFALLRPYLPRRKAACESGVCSR
jgi:predicted DCC family thiol-disulfide oxidoreductase YuxK